MAVKVRFTVGIEAVVGWGADVGRLEEVDVDGSSSTKCYIMCMSPSYWVTAQYIVLGAL